MYIFIIFSVGDFSVKYFSKYKNKHLLTLKFFRKKSTHPTEFFRVVTLP